MLHPDLSALLQQRLEIIGDHSFRDRDPEAHLEALKTVSEEITQWHHAHQGTLLPRLEHFLSGCSYEKALRFLQSNGTSTEH